MATTQQQLDDDCDRSILTEPNHLAATIRDRVDDVLGRPDTTWADIVPTYQAGLCWVCSQAYYFGCNEAEQTTLTPKQVEIEIEHPLFIGTVSHWFLEADDGTILDLTKEQFDVMCVDVPYDNARGRGFGGSTAGPTNDAKELLADSAVAAAVSEHQ